MWVKKYTYLCSRFRAISERLFCVVKCGLCEMGKYQSGQMGQTVNLLAYAFGGSNPSLPTNSGESRK